MTTTCALLLLLFSAGAAAAPRAAILQPRPPQREQDVKPRPAPTRISAATQGSDYALHLTFDQLPWGPECRSRCADVLLYLDTDGNRSTGLRPEAGAKQKGADLAIWIQGVRDFRERGAESLLQVRVKQLPDGAASWADGETLAELDNRHDPDRVQSEGSRVFVLVDASSLTIPAGRSIRLIYAPQVGPSIEAAGRGMGAGSSAPVPFHRVHPGRGKR